MKIKDYLSDKVVFLGINLTAYLIISGALFYINTGFVLIFALFCIWFLPLISYICIDYLKYRKYFNSIYNILDGLDKKYLLPEVIEEHNFIIAEEINHILKVVSRDMHENIKYYIDNQKEYKEYIETWVHEIKTPIASARLILENDEGYINKSVLEEIEKVEGFIEQVLFYARSSTVERDYIIKKIPLKNSINSVIRKNANILIEKRVKIQLEDIEKKVYCDSKWIEFILQQIISNSVKYMDKDEKYIKIRCLEKDKNIILKILDNGIGISEKSIEKVFEKGYTGENGRKYNNSTGMGLYLCKKLCLKLGLGISIKSKLGVGTEVTIVFPINNYNLAED